MSAKPWTYWNGEHCNARKVYVTVAEKADGDSPLLWWFPYAGKVREAVEVTYAGETFYIDDGGHEPSQEYVKSCQAVGVTPRGHEPGQGWWKVTAGHGGPASPHSSLRVVPGSVMDR